MSIETERIFNYLSETYVGANRLSNIFHSFSFCSRDSANRISLVASTTKCINFDKLTEWIYESQPPQSADSLTFSHDYVYLIEFKAGDQVGHETKREKMIEGVIGKINDSHETIYRKIISKIETIDAENIKLRFYLVVDIKKMGISPLAATLASLSRGSSFSDPKIAALLQIVLPDLKKGTIHPDHYDQIDIWYSELFDTYLSAHKIIDIDKMFTVS